MKFNKIDSGTVADSSTFFWENADSSTLNIPKSEKRVYVYHWHELAGQCLADIDISSMPPDKLTNEKYQYLGSIKLDD